ncbi:MAG: hypothetical protein ABI338_04210 [Gemmatimonadaceae bacterium]
MRQRTLHIGLASAIAAILVIAPISASAQMMPGNYRVLVDGMPAGMASTVANLPTSRVVVTQDSNPNIASRQVESNTQEQVTLMTSDSTLVSAMQGWMAADNSGTKNTVQRKTVEIDRASGTGPGSHYVLKGAWPTKIESVGAQTVITIVYQRLVPVTS